MKKIGILGGLGPESTAAYYEYITQEYYRKYGDYAYPEIIIYSMNFKEVIDVGYEAPEQIKNVIESLHKAGADFVVAACNSIHIVYDEVAKDISIPWFSIIDAAAEEIKESNITKVGVLGTVFTMSKGFYTKGLARHQIESVVPSAEDQETVNNIIFKELITNTVTEESRQAVLKIIDKLIAQGAQAIVLGCTELPFLIKQEDLDVKVINTTVVHAQKTLQMALAD